ncbi:MAG: DUF4302 domain-containing protein [Prevotella sp.]|nr:DUF4302 domain-containing protein [Prevotella sp.]
MNTKLILTGLSSILCPLSFSIALSSCTFEQEDYFDESASLRITHLNEQLQQRLVEQSDTTQGRHGWVIQYFVGGTDDYDFEGFNLFARFYQNGKVTLAGNHRYLRGGQANKYTEHSSSYEMLAEEGPVLSFNTWNDILTVFEDPVDPTAAPANLVNNGEGMYGDHNLVLRSISDDDIQFRGERHSANIRFIPADRPWQEYIDLVNTTKNYIATSTLTSYYVTNGADTMYFSGLNRGYFNYCDRVADPLINSVLSCVFTPNGFRLNHDATLGDNVFREFTMSADSTCLLSENGDVKVMATWDSYILSRTRVWNFDPELYTAEQEAIVAQIEAELKKRSSAWSLQGIGMGRSTGKDAVSGLVLTIYTNTRQSSTTTVGLSVNTQSNGFGQVRIEADPNKAVDGNMTSVVNNGATQIVDLVYAFASTIYGTYSMVPDNYFLPTGCEYVPQGAGTRFILK